MHLGSESHNALLTGARCNERSELFSETNDNSVALLTYGTARALLTRPTAGRRTNLNGERPLHEALSGHQRLETTHTLSQGSVPC